MPQDSLRKIVIAGAGAYHFAPAILDDLFVRTRTPAELWLVDANLELAELTARAGQALARAFGVQSRFYYTTQLHKALFSADAVIVCADFLDAEAWHKDVQALDAVGLGKQARLRGGIGGAMQTMRAVGFIAEVAQQMREECPDAPLILCDSGYGGLPLCRACDAAQRFFGIRALGVSGVTEQTRARLALYLDVPKDDLLTVCAGLNGFSWVAQLRDTRRGVDLIPRCQKEMAEDSREALSAMLIDWYGAIPAGARVTQEELLADTPLSPRHTVTPPSGVGAADFALRQRNLALLVAHGPISPQGLPAWQQVRDSGLQTARPVQLLRALWGEECCKIPSLTMPCDGAIPGVREGVFVEGPAQVDAEGVAGFAVTLPVELETALEQLTMCNGLYAEAAALGSRRALREALEVDPALAGVDLLYTEGVLSDMMEGQQDKLPRFFA